MKMKYLCVIFDLDGTLVDTLEDIAVSMNRSLKLRGFPELTLEEYSTKIGWGINRLAYLALPEDSRKEVTSGIIASAAAKYYTENPLRYSRPYPGVLDLISELKKKKVKTAVLTNKLDHLAQKVISGLFPPGSFDCVQGEIQGKPRKPNPDCVWELLVGFDVVPASTIFIGDSEVDMETAISAGCFPMGVSWGYRLREVMEKAGARHIIDKPCELLEFFL